eukprot:2751102-Prymnesium_polylepis.1
MCNGASQEAGQATTVACEGASSVAAGGLALSIGLARPGPALKPCEAAERPVIAAAAVGARLARRGAVALDGRRRGGVHVCGRVRTCIG